jgi:hypothetical protein
LALHCEVDFYRIESTNQRWYAALMARWLSTMEEAVKNIDGDSEGKAVK